MRLRRTSLRRLLVAPLAAGALLLASRAAAAEEGCISAQCHEKLIKRKVVHPVTESCGNCHESVATPHPQRGAKTFKLTAAPPALCDGCHDAFGKKSHVHEPVKDGSCTTCHDPHAADEPKLLAQPLKELCATCHSDKVDFKFVHGPVAAGDCTACHTPHESDTKALLKKEEKETCLTCHATVVAKSMTLLHGPINDGKCTPCHDPHGGPYPRLLVKEFPADPYVPYTASEFGLCFGCHKRELVQDPDTSFATNFRDGERNLHYLHVNNPRRGRSCKLCHAVHGGALPKLVAETVPFGKWNLPLRFVKTATGGSCAPGCHRPQSYDRESPGKKPEATTHVAGR
ncbi:MAG: cytochrome C [Acidobacteriia bacterium]|nr:cytochrome C [Terriglobia bacterium]